MADERDRSFYSVSIFSNFIEPEMTLLMHFSKNYFGFKMGTGGNFELRANHRTEEGYAIATVSINGEWEWEDSFEADLGDLALQPLKFTIAVLNL